MFLRFYHFPKNRDTPIAAKLAFHHVGGASIGAEFDWLEQGAPTWTITIETDDGKAMLTEGGARFSVDGAEQVAGADQEYPRLYNHFTELLAQEISEIDIRPMRHVADAFTLGKRVVVDRFDW